QRARGQLMLALYGRGRRGDALAAYRRVRDVLGGELGAAPGEPLQRLHASVLAHDPALDWQGDRPVLVEAHRPDADILDSSPAPKPRRRQAGPGRGRAWARWRGRRPLVIGAALAVAPAPCTVARARPWAGGAAGPPDARG